MEIFEKIYHMTALSDIIADPRFLIMYCLAFLLLYLGIKKQFEPLLLVPIAFGVLIANFPGGGMGVLGADGEGLVHYMKDGVMVAKNVYEMPLPEIAHDLGLMNYIYYALIKSGLLPPFRVFLFMAVIGIILLNIINMFLLNRTLNIVTCIVSLIVFLGYVAFDIQKIKRMSEYDDI
ncbi:MAG: sodium ion-translocating decarboxylase subunit beta, partial [Paludibacteraceae bacterium]|nr:sodium ion-translocating decarboxylase subunit beta [Paludibacteraceae bacterium]